MAEVGLRPNEGKNLTIELANEKWARLPIKTKVVVDGDDLAEIIKQYV